MKKGICILFICLFGGVLTYAQSPQDVIKKSDLEKQEKFERLKKQLYIFLVNRRKEPSAVQAFQQA